MTTTTTIDPAILETLPESFPAEEEYIELSFPDDHDLDDPEAHELAALALASILRALELEIDDMELCEAGDDGYIGWRYFTRNDEKVKLITKYFPYCIANEQERFQESVEEAGLAQDDLPENLFDYYDLQVDEGGDQVYVRKSL